MKIKHYLAILFIFLCCNHHLDVVDAWTKLCPQSNLRELCKCSPGEQCCLCPNPRPIMSHTHWTDGINDESSGNPCSKMVSPNGCTVGGICPPCGGSNRAFTNAECVDEPSCSRLGLTRALCSAFDDIRHRYVKRLHEQCLIYHRN